MFAPQRGGPPLHLDEEVEVVEEVEEVEEVEAAEGGAVGSLAGPVLPCDMTRRRSMQQSVAANRKAGQEIRQKVGD